MQDPAPETLTPEIPKKTPRKTAPKRESGKRAKQGNVARRRTSPAAPDAAEQGKATPSSQETAAETKPKAQRRRKKDSGAATRRRAVPAPTAPEAAAAPVAVAEKKNEETISEAKAESRSHFDDDATPAGPSIAACPRCASHRVKRSHTRNDFERFLKAINIRAYRCIHCGWRGFRFSVGTGPRLRAKYSLVQILLVALILAVVIFATLHFLSREEGPHEIQIGQIGVRSCILAFFA